MGYQILFSFCNFRGQELQNFQLELGILVIKYEEHVSHYIIKICNYVWIAVQGLHVLNEVHIVCKAIKMKKVMEVKI